MFSVVKHVAPPRICTRRKRLLMYKGRRQAVLDSPPPPDVIDNDQCYGEYCIKAVVEMTGKEEKTFIGYSQDIDIAVKTRYACEKDKGTCSDPVITFRGGDCKEALFVKTKDGKTTRLFAI